VLADALAHTVGVVLALLGIAALISKAQNLTGAHAASVWIYCIGLITSFGISATYNMWPMCTRKMVLRRLDHSAIYFFIAATYSPFLLGTEQSVYTAVLLIGIWALASIGVTLKLVAPGRFDRISIVLYLAMGWSGVLADESVFSQLSPLSLSFIIAGASSIQPESYSICGISYAFKTQFGMRSWLQPPPSNTPRSSALYSPPPPDSGNRAALSLMLTLYAQHGRWRDPASLVSPSGEQGAPEVKDDFADPNPVGWNVRIACWLAYHLSLA
jgi:channel protein (hemolysin III family)